MSSDSTDHENVDALEELEAELHGTWIFGGKTFLTAFLGSIPDMPPDSMIEGFVQGYEGYNSTTRKWKRITVPAKTEASLYEPFRDHINAILEEFGRNTRCEASATCLTGMAHALNVYQTSLKTQPDLCLMGVDPLIAREQTFPDPPKYTHCVAPIEIKCQAALRWGHDAVQLAVYARECFVQQPNRDLVYASLLTEEQMQLHQFDRGGDLHSSFFNIHEDPVTFVKMILALSTEDLEKLGFDTRIYWDGSRRYFRTISEDSREVKIYTISEPDHPFRRHTICGRGTTCWVIQNETGEKVVLKLAWRTFERLPEWHFLEKICEENRRRALEEPERGPIPGVGTILAHWEGKRLSELRFGVALKTPDEQTVSDRRFYYTLQPYLGAALEKAASTLQSLRALYDIIQGQRELYDLKILHRDISTRNMLCNPDPEAQAGQRGFLIDFDMAKKLDSPSNTAGADERTGTRAFQSIKVLEGLGVHDYLDDLESTFWAYTWIVCTSDGPGVARLGVPVDLINWGSQDLAVAILAKRNFLARPLVDLIHPAMGRHVRVLILWFAGFFQDTALARIRRLEQERYQGMLEKDADVQRAAVFLRQDGLGNDASAPKEDSDVDRHFTLVLNAVKRAIDGEEKTSLEAPDTKLQSIIAKYKVPELGVQSQGYDHFIAEKAKEAKTFKSADGDIVMDAKRLNSIPNLQLQYGGSRKRQRVSGI